METIKNVNNDQKQLEIITFLFGKLSGEKEKLAKGAKWTETSET